MYPNMQIRTVMVGDKQVKTCSECYIINLDDWSEGFALAQVKRLMLTGEY